MRSQDGGAEVAVANGVAGVRGADDLDLVLGEVGDLAVVGAELGVAEGDDAGDLVLLGLGKAFNGAVVDGGSLAILQLELDLVCFDESAVVLTSSLRSQQWRWGTWWRCFQGWSPSP